MLPDPVILAAVILVSLSSVYILVSNDWRYCIIALAVQYIGVFILVNGSWPIEMAAAKMVAGWMAGAILAIAMTSIPNHLQNYKDSVKFSPIFRLLVAVIVSLMITSVVLHSDSWLSMVAIPIRWGSFILVSLGLLQLSLTSHPLRAVIGLLTALSGFEIIYAAIETSTLVTGLLAGVNLGLALVGAYLLTAPTMEGNP